MPYITITRDVKALVETLGGLRWRTREEALGAVPLPSSREVSVWISYRTQKKLDTFRRLDETYADALRRLLGFDGSREGEEAR